MNDKVIQITDKLVTDLKERKVIRDTEEYIPIELDPVDYAAGESSIGTLTADEAKIFLEIFTIQDDIDHFARELKARGFRHAAELITADDALGMPEGFAINDEYFLSEADSKYFYELVLKFRYLNGLFWYGVKSRLDVFQYEIGIRKGLVVVKISDKFNRERK